VSGRSRHWIKSKNPNAPAVKREAEIDCHAPGTVPVGMMIAGTQNTDRKILAIGLAVEEVARKPRG